MRKIKRALELNINYFLLRRMPILTYSMERTGSTAMFSSLKSQGVFAIGCHYLDPKKIATPLLAGSTRWACRHIIIKRKPAKVITLVRSPLENMLSTFARSDYGEQEARQNGAASQAAPLSPDQLSDDFYRTYLKTDRYLGPLEWFTNEFQSALGINVYEYSFDKQNGHGRIRQEPYDVLILRTEMPDEQKADLVAEFLGLSTFEFVKSSTVAVNDPRLLPSGRPGDQMCYADKYRALKQGIVIPQPHLDAIVDSRHVQHFFTQEERDEMRAKYCGEVAQGA